MDRRLWVHPGDLADVEDADTSMNLSTYGFALKHIAIDIKPAAGFFDEAASLVKPRCGTAGDAPARDEFNFRSVRTYDFSCYNSQPQPFLLAIERG
jgi:hypothetical protein